MLAVKVVESDRHPAWLSMEELEKHCHFRRTRRSGPGGQHRNKVESAVIVTHELLEISAEANERRSQHENRKVALERLRLRLAIQVRRQIDADSEPSERWQERTKGGKINVSLAHHDFATVLAEALDFVMAAQFDVAHAAKQLEVSTSQLVKFLKAENDALLWVNQQRSRKNLGKLK